MQKRALSLPGSTDNRGGFSGLNGQIDFFEKVIFYWICELFMDLAGF
jgi:hypothetical protein